MRLLADQMRGQCQFSSRDDTSPSIRCSFAEKNRGSTLKPDTPWFLAQTFGLQDLFLGVTLKIFDFLRRELRIHAKRMGSWISAVVRSDSLQLFLARICDRSLKV